MHGMGASLVERQYWEAVKHGLPEPTPARRFATRLLGPRLVELLARRHADEHLYGTVLAQHLPARPDWRVLEIGSAPGVRLLWLHRQFGYQPYGVEYTAAGAATNRTILAGHGFPANHVIEADFFAPELQQRHREAFDVVCSFGFLEHFSDPAEVVRRHAELVRPGGWLAIVIPNLRGLNKLLAEFFNRDVIALHNLAIMQRDAFARLFARRELETRFCDYVGLFNFETQNTDPSSWKRHLLHLAKLAETPLQVAATLLLRQHNPQHAWYSPYLAYVGEKRR
jgi:2-polyprenyl-3-methyl-5-hydroxy-6-metoxy-1,4-benzoquinol methylase